MVSRCVFKNTRPIRPPPVFARLRSSSSASASSHGYASPLRRQRAVQDRLDLATCRRRQRRRRATPLLNRPHQADVVPPPARPRWFLSLLLSWRRRAGPRNSLAYTIFDALLLLPDPAFVLAGLRMCVHTGIYISSKIARSTIVERCSSAQNP